MADGGGRGHFASMKEIRAVLADHERRLKLVERDVLQLTDIVAQEPPTPEDDDTGE